MGCAILNKENEICTNAISAEFLKSSNPNHKIITIKASVTCGMGRAVKSPSSHPAQSETNKLTGKSIKLNN